MTGCGNWKIVLQPRTCFKINEENPSTLVIGDFNVEVGRDKWDPFVQFCRTKELVIPNTLHTLTKRKLYTRETPRETNETIVTNQIDIVRIQQRFRSCIRSAKTYPRADIDSNYNPLALTTRMKLKIIKETTQKPIDVKRLKKQQVKKIYRTLQKYWMGDYSTLVNAWNGNLTKKRDKT